MLSGIHYAILYHHLDIFKFLLKHESQLLTLDKTYIPSQKLSNFQQPGFMDKEIDLIFK